MAGSRYRRIGVVAGTLLIAVIEWLLLQAASTSSEIRLGQSPRWT